MTTAMSTVAVVLCNYNHAKYLPDSLGHICRQTRPADQIIVIDDGSTDDSWDIIQRFARDYSNVEARANGRNLGLEASIASALQMVRCDYLVWAAADDRSAAVVPRTQHDGPRRPPRRRAELFRGGRAQGRQRGDRPVRDQSGGAPHFRSPRPSGLSVSRSAADANEKRLSAHRLEHRGDPQRRAQGIRGISPGAALVRRLFCLHRARDAARRLRACGAAGAHSIEYGKLFSGDARRTATDEGLERDLGHPGSARISATSVPS